MWSSVFGRVTPNVLALMRDAALGGGRQQGRPQQQPWTLCFRRLVVPPPGIAAPICQV
jgi:hypothetical protein